MEMRRGVGLLATIGLTSGMLGWVTGQALSESVPGPEGDAVSVPVSSSAPSPTPTPTPTSAPSTSTTMPAHPLRILLAGDSVMAGLAPAVTSALGTEGGAEIEFVLTPSLLRDDTVRFTWSRELERFDPDVVVMFVGTWELGEVTADTGRPVTSDDDTWQATYDQEILEPWVELVTAEGARVLWLGAPAVASREVGELFEALNGTYRTLAERRPDVTYLDTTTALASTASDFVPVVTTPDGRTVRIRQVDGLHLCPDGAVLLAQALIDELGDATSLATAPDWEAGVWRLGDEYPPESCPPP